MTSRLDLGVVPYLNALPLYRTLESSGQARVLRAVPSKLAAMLDRGDCDAAILPVVDYLRGVGETILSDACIGTKAEGEGAVRSVLLFHCAPIAQIKSVAVDMSSHTSVALLRVLLADAHGVLPPFHEHEPNLARMLQNHEAALLIGDAALEAKNAVEASVDNPGAHILDLGAEWKKLTGLPFVFAAWVARRGLEENTQGRLGKILGAARDEGLQSLSTLIAESPIQTTLPGWQIEEYLREAVAFGLTDQHREAIEEFRRRCLKYSLL